MRNVMYNKTLKFYLVVTVITTLFSYCSSIIHPTKYIDVSEGEGFVAYLEVNEDFGPIKNCWYQYGSYNEVLIDLDSNLPQRAPNREIILPFSTTVCGIHVSGVNPSTSAKWTLTAQDSNGLLESDSLSVRINTVQKVRFDTFVEKDVGFDYISCSKHSTLTQYCQIINEEKNWAWKSCSVNTWMRPNMTFHCYIYNSDRILASYEKIKIIPKTIQTSTEADQEETENQIILRCKSQDKLKNCLAQKSLSRESLLIKEGLYNGHYSAYDTLESKSLCALAIFKPLDSTDKGLWRIIGSDFTAGCLYYVGDNRSKIIEQELSNLKNYQTIQVYSDAKSIPEISILVPFTINDCYLRDPKNTIYFPNAKEFEKTRQYGKCVIKNLPVLAGVWMLGVISSDHPMVVNQTINVTVEPKTGNVVTTHVEADYGNSAFLMCISPFGEPLENCAFISPLNQVFLVATSANTKTKGRIQYDGTGLLQGECGVKIDQLIEEDFGTWQCQFTILAAERTTASFKMELQRPYLNQANSVGLASGIAGIVIMIGFMAIVTFYFKKKYFKSQTTLIAAQSMETLDENGRVRTSF